MQRLPGGLRFRDLPGFSRLFVDWVEGSHAARDFLPLHPEIGTLRKRALDLQSESFLRTEMHGLLKSQAELHGAREHALQNIEKLLLPGSVAVLASITPAFAGGPLELLLKCATAARLAAELESLGIPALPLCWLNREARLQRESASVTLIDREARAERFESPLSGDGYDEPIPDAITEGISRIESRIGLSTGDAVMQEFRQAFAPGTPYSQASVRFISSLVKDLGIVLLDPGDSGFATLALRRLKRPPLSAAGTAALIAPRVKLLREAGYISSGDSEGEPASGNDAEPTGGGQNVPTSGPMALSTLEAALPVVCHVVSSREMEGIAAVQPFFQNQGLRPPLIWPRASATIFDTRSLKILQKYGISLTDLLSDKSRVLPKLMHGEEFRSVLSSFEDLDRLIDERLAQTGKAAASDASVKEMSEETRSKILFQTGKLRERYEAAVAQRGNVIARHWDRISGVLAPEGRMQEEVIAGLHFILHSSPGFTRELYDNIDIQGFEHQLISAE